ncbi:MAG TPA: NADP-dependent phosphogluconate dehydrogenase [Ferruginibacter sp.]|nr:NADP-dependent phosphogluconate dehydrogenase [Ferruginibacter sp.]
MKYNFGMIGLGTMGCNLVLNMNDKGFSVAGYDKDISKIEILNKLSTGKNIKGFPAIEEFLESLTIPRIIILLVPAGPIVDAVLFELQAELGEDDLVIDCGNSHFTDTQRRIDSLKESRIRFMGVGISGGETGARFGPSIMPGGDPGTYERVMPMFEKIAAVVKESPCAAYMGKGAAGHYVKMVHNGIEYALMQLIAETYHILKRAGFTNPELHHLFDEWNNGRLKSFLIEITAAIFIQKDEPTGEYLLNRIADTAHQKGTGAWMSEDAMEIQSPIPVIDASVSQRILSSLKSQRIEASELYNNDNSNGIQINKESLAVDLEKALHFGFITTFAQGLAMLQQASGTHQYNIDIEKVTAIWRGGCIIRASILENILLAYKKQPHILNLMLSGEFSQILDASHDAVRKIIHYSFNSKIPVPAFAASLNYYYSYHSEWLPANLIQAQRDFFGAHTYERTDMEGSFHTIWSETIQ